MGYEYRLSFVHPGDAAVTTSLSKIGGATSISTNEHGFEFRHEPSQSGMPDATAVVEEYGLYFCNHGGHGREYLGFVVTALVQNFGAVTIEELE